MGWLLAGVTPAESVAEHSYGVALLPLLLAEEINQDWSSEDTTDNDNNDDDNQEDSLDGTLRLYTSPWSPPACMKNPTWQDEPGAVHAQAMTYSTQPSCLRNGTGPASRLSTALRLQKVYWLILVHCDCKFSPHLRIRLSGGWQRRGRLHRAENLSVVGSRLERIGGNADAPTRQRAI